MSQETLFEKHEASTRALDGFRYQADFIDQSYEKALIANVVKLPFREFEFHGYLGKRRVVSFGFKYEYTGGGRLLPAEAIPEFLLDLRARAASYAEREASSFQQALVTEYVPGAGIGWHRDKAVFGEVVGVSLLSACVLRFRREVNAKSRWERVNITAEPRSVYFLSGPARAEWEHSILSVDALRYSITFRSVV